MGMSRHNVTAARIALRERHRQVSDELTRESRVDYLLAEPTGALELLPVAEPLWPTDIPHLPAPCSFAEELIASGA